ncbi:MAG TPA: glycosyltransferase [bacterium]|nr:glycosyltransferase [bacterium]
MRIAVLGHTYIVAGNRGKFHALRERGHEIFLASPAAWPEPDFGLRRFAPDSRFAVALFDCPHAGHVRRFRYPHPELMRALRTWRPDALLAETEPGGLAALQAAYAAVALGLPLLPFAWENLPLDFRSRVSAWPVYRAARRLLVGSRTAARTARDAGYRGPLTVTPQVGVPEIDAPPVRRARKQPHALFVGRLDRKKGVNLLLDALTLPAAKDWRATIVGDGSERDALRAQAARLKILTRVTFVDAVSHDRVPALLAEADALVALSRTVPGWAEQFGHILAQAMNAGVPVVASRCGAIPEVVGDAGLLVAENDATAAAEALARLHDPAPREMLGAIGRERAQRLYTDRAVAARLEQALIMALERNGDDVLL